MTKRLCWLASALSLLLAACAPQADGSAQRSASLSYGGSSIPASEVVITLERTPCFGFCPAYKLTVYGDGRVRYEGYRFVGVMGEQTHQLAPDEVARLLAAFERADYFSLADSYAAMSVSDMPSAITSLTLGARSKTVEHYYGDESAPEALTQLEAAIDEIVGARRWTEGDAGPRR